MEYFYSLCMLCLCSVCLWLMMQRNDGAYLVLGVTGLFSIGYYVLPVLFKEESGLSYFSSSEVAPIVGMSLLFFISLIAGNLVLVKFGSAWLRATPYFPALDEIYGRHYKLAFWFGFCVWILYFFSIPETSYMAEDVEAFFHEKGPYDTVLSAMSWLGQSAMAISIALSRRNRASSNAAVMLGAYFCCVTLLLGTGQRLAVITPIFTLIAALFILGETKSAIRFLMFGIVALLLISPLMVSIREFQGFIGSEKAIIAASQFSYTDSDILRRLLLSIMQRSDLIEVSIYLKKYIDSVGNVSGMYYESIMFSFLPSFLVGVKPYPLSDDGTIWGEISVVAWTLLQGSTTGSLTAFGAISAYREGGWFWVPVNGFLTGVSFALVSLRLISAGLISKLLYCSVFVSLCVKLVPPSFFQLVVNLAAYVNVFICLLIFDRLVPVFSRKYHSRDT
jgi:hypothetical protein